MCSVIVFRIVRVRQTEAGLANYHSGTRGDYTLRWQLLPQYWSSNSGQHGERIWVSMPAYQAPDMLDDPYGYTSRIVSISVFSWQPGSVLDGGLRTLSSG